MENNIKSDIERMIEMKNRERQIVDLFYQMCPSVPPQLLASTVIETIENFRQLQNLYSSYKHRENLSDDAADALRYAVECSLNPELFKCSYQQSLIPPNENPTEIAKRIEEGIKRSFETHIPRID